VGSLNGIGICSCSFLEEAVLTISILFEGANFSSTRLILDKTGSALFFTGCSKGLYFGETFNARFLDKPAVPLSFFSLFLCRGDL